VNIIRIKYGGSQNRLSIEKVDYGQYLGYNYDYILNVWECDIETIGFWVEENNITLLYEKIINWGHDPIMFSEELALMLLQYT